MNCASVSVSNIYVGERMEGLGGGLYGTALCCGGGEFTGSAREGCLLLKWVFWLV